LILLEILPQALVCQLSNCSALAIHGGRLISKNRERAATYGSYIIRRSLSLRSAALPSASLTFSAASVLRRRASSSGGGPSPGGQGAVLKIWDKSTTACRAIAKVNSACLTEAPWTPTITRAQVSSMVVTAPSQDWLLCWDR